MFHMKGKVEADGSGVFGNAFIGPWSANASYAAVVHKNHASVNRGNNYAMLQGQDGTTYVSGGKGKTLRMGVENTQKVVIGPDGNVSINGKNAVRSAITQVGIYDDINKCQEIGWKNATIMGSLNGDLNEHAGGKDITLCFKSV